LLTVTEAAARKIGQAIESQQEPVFGLRVLVQAGGCCSGYAYGLTLAPEREAHDWVGEFGNIKVVVDPQSAVFLEGASIDWVETEQGSGFTISNPQEPRGCGCQSATSEDGHAHAGGGCGCGGH